MSVYVARAGFSIKNVGIRNGGFPSVVKPSLNFYTVNKGFFCCVRRNTSQSDQTENSFLLTEKKHSYIHTIVWIYASRAEHKNRITNIEEGVKEKVYT